MGGINLPIFPMREKRSTTVPETVTPNSMPGATAVAGNMTNGISETATDKPAESTKADKAAPKATIDGRREYRPELDADERAELARLRELHRDEQKFRREATEKHAAAEAYEKLLETLGAGKGKEAKGFDAEAAIKELKSGFETERQARIRETVARTEQVDPDDFTGTTEEEMRASARKFKAKVEACVAAALEKAKQGKQSAAAPANEVTANGKVTDTKQKTSVAGMTRQQIIEAHKAGQLEDLVAGRTK